MNKIVAEKLNQLPAILKEMGVDLWLTFGRESSSTPDPCADMIIGSGYTWQSAFILTKEGKRIAIVGSLEEAHFKAHGIYSEIISYKDSIRAALKETLSKLNPQKIAINSSIDNVLADGLSHAMYNKLLDYLEGTPYGQRLISSEEIVLALRGRKSRSELANIKEAIRHTEEIIDLLTDFLKVGLSEKEVAAFILAETKKRDLELAWDEEHCPAVFTGPDSAGAHSGPTDRKIAKGHLLNIDFGVKVNGYCSDMQRTWYFLNDGEKKAPAIVQKAFDTIHQAISKAALGIKPGIASFEVDNLARSYITDKGFEEYQHGLGHEIGLKAHDGSILCPQWERYGKTPYNKLEAGQVYTLEPRIILQDYGVATIEEIAVVKKSGGVEFLSTPQRKLWLIS